MTLRQRTGVCALAAVTVLGTLAASSTSSAAARAAISTGCGLVDGASLVRTFSSANDYLSDAEFSPNGGLVALAGDNATVIDAVATGTQLKSFPANGSSYSASFTSDGTRLLVANWKGTAAIYNVSTGRRLVQVSAGNWINSGAWSPDDVTFATGSRNGSAQIWNAKTGALVESLRPGLEVFGVAFSPNGSLLVTTTDDGAQLWNIATRREIATAGKYGTGFTTSFSPNGNDIIFGGEKVYPNSPLWSSTEVVWSLATKHVVNTFVGPMGDVFGTPAFSPNGDVVAIPDDNSGRVTFWCVATGQTLGSFTTDSGKGVAAVAFGANGTEILSADQSGVARLWRLRAESSAHSNVPPPNRDNDTKRRER
jgi:WD40 repeat protein